MLLMPILCHVQGGRDTISNGRAARTMQQPRAPRWCTSLRVGRNRNSTGRLGADATQAEEMNTTCHKQQQQQTTTTTTNNNSNNYYYNHKQPQQHIGIACTVPFLVYDSSELCLNSLCMYYIFKHACRCVPCACVRVYVRCCSCVRIQNCNATQLVVAHLPCARSKAFDNVRIALMHHALCYLQGMHASTCSYHILMVRT